jgi:hypothetical protein
LSQEILHENGVIISAPTSKPPMFNYPAFCTALSINDVDYKIEQLLQQSILTQNLINLDDKKFIVKQEIFKLFMKQISSLKKLNYGIYIPYIVNTPYIAFTTYPGANDCLKNLSELECRSKIYPEFFYQLSQICHNIESLTIELKEVISNGLADLISAQKNLKCLYIAQYEDCENFADIIPSLTKLSNTLIKFSFIAKFTNLQDFQLSFNYDHLDDFKKLLYITFSQLQILEFKFARPSCELLVKFLKNNGKNLKELDVGEGESDSGSDNSLNSAIAKLCPNLRKLSIRIKNDELETLKIVFSNCQYLESIKFLCGGEFLSEKEVLGMIVKYSPKNFHELILHHLYDLRSELLPEELESFFVSWTNRIPQRLLSFVIINYDNTDSSLDKNVENMEIIEKYINLGVIKKFKVIDFLD